MRRSDLQAIYGHVCPRCGHLPRPHAEGDLLPTDIATEAQRVAKALYNGKALDYDPALTKAVAAELRKAIIEGWGKDLNDLSYGTPDYKMLASLEVDCYHFAAAKTWQQLRSFTLALRDENGAIRSWGDFKEQAAKITNEYGKHLRTEYETAIGSAQMASRWVDLEKNREVAPWLRYDTAGDSKVRTSHKALDGTTKRIDDPFWNMWYPPNGWNCRCDVSQHIHGADSGDYTAPEKTPTIFLTNLAKTGNVFPKGHPYYNGIPDNILNKATHLRDSYYSKAYESKSGGSVSVSSVADKNDLDNNLRLSTILADNREHVWIRPHSFLDKVKNPELALYNQTQTGDFKEPETPTKNSYEKNIVRTAKQGGNIPVFVFNDSNYNRMELLRALKNELNWAKAKSITEVWLLKDKNLIKISREEIFKGLHLEKIP